MKNFGYQNFHASLSDSTQLLTILIGIWNTDWAVGPRHNLNNASFSNAVDLLAPLHIPEKASFVFSYGHDPATQLQPWTTYFLSFYHCFFIWFGNFWKKKTGNSIDVVEYKQNSSFEEATTVKIEGQNSNFSIE